MGDGSGRDGNLAVSIGVIRNSSQTPSTPSPITHHPSPASHPSPQNPSFTLIRRQALSASLIEFTKLMYPGYRPAPFHLRVAAELEAVARGETRYLAIMLPPRHGKPVYNKCMILMGDGTYRSLENIVVGDYVVSHSGNPCLVVATHDQGDLPCVKIVTRTGREAVVALDHPFLTPSGWVKAGDLSVGMALANVPNANVGGEYHRHEEMRLAGYIVGDGNVSPTHRGIGITASITCFDEKLGEDIVACAEALGFGSRLTARRRINLRGGVRDWLREIGLAGCGAATKRVPEFVFRSAPSQIAHFIGAYFSCDGHINSRGGKRKDACVEIYSINRPLLGDAQRLLLRLGIQSRVSIKRSSYTNYTKGPHTSYRLTISSQDDVARFVERVPVFGSKMAALREWGVIRQRFDEKLFSDEIVAVEPSEDLPCRCLTVEPDHTFTVEDLVVHNSLLSSQHFPAWYLGKFPDKRIIACSYGDDLAHTFSRHARNMMRDDHWPFPDVQPAADARAVKAWEIAGHRGGYRAAGVGSGITGHGANCILIDDAVKDKEQADSALMREKTWDWYQSTSYTRLDPSGGAVVMIGTRWHADDLIGRALRDGDYWRVLRLPAEAEEDDPLGRQPGEWLWPEQFSPERYQEIRARVGPRNWNALYQQRPSSEEGTMFPRSAWRSYRPGAEPPLREIVISVDSAFKQGVGSDYTVFAVWGADGLGSYYVLDRLKERLEFPELIASGHRLYEQWRQRSRKVSLLVEDRASGQSAIQVWGRVSYGPAGPLPALPVIRWQVPGGRSKESRADEVTHLILAGRVYLPENTPWVADFVQEHVEFPHGAHDDQVDTTAQALGWFLNQPRRGVITF